MTDSEVSFHLAFTRRFIPLMMCDSTWIGGGRATFALWNLSGQLVGYQTYTPHAPKGRQENPRDQRYFTYVTPGQLGVWGLESLNVRRRVLYLAEGIFEACLLHRLGYAAIAVLGNDPQHLKSWLRTLSVRTVAILQGDGPSQHLRKYADSAIQLATGTDLADYSFLEINTLITEEKYAMV